MRIAGFCFLLRVLSMRQMNYSLPQRFTVIFTPLNRWDSIGDNKNGDYLSQTPLKFNVRTQ
jgi:hypothetical protein